MRNFASQRIINSKSGLPYQVHCGGQLEILESHFENIAKICNQAEVYKLFGERWKGEPYSIQNAKDFVSWIQSGWKDSEHFVFLVTSEDSRIAAALDIKSANLATAEIGYWCDSAHHGITGNAVRAMMGWAQDVGFQSLHAKPINERSMLLLERQGFIRESDDETAEGSRWVYQFAEKPRSNKF